MRASPVCFFNSSKNYYFKPFIMKLKSIFSVLAVTLLFVSFANAQPTTGGDPQICLACAPSLSPINVQTTPNDCYLRFTTNSGLSSRCTRLSYEWTTSDPLAVINSYQGDASIKFSSDDDITVCCTLTVGFDRNGNGVFDADEKCQVAQCVTVSVPDYCP